MANDMSSAMDMLRDLLSGPDAGEKIGSMLSAFTDDSAETDNSGEGGGSKESFDIGSILDGDISGVLSSIGDLPIDSIMKMANAYRQASSKDDPRVNLLRAMRPYLQPHRHSNLDQAVKLLGFLKFLPMLGELKDII